MRIAAAVVGGLAVVAMVIVGCTSMTGGTATIDKADAPAYRASVTASVEESAARSSARESERQVSLTKEAIHTACEDLSSSSVDAVMAVNAYVDAFNTSSDVAAKSGPAVDALNRSADLVSSGITDSIPAELRDGLNAWVDAARAVATAVAQDLPTDQFNDAIVRLNDSRDHAVNLCDAAY
ncbi:MAG: hypothetical protein JST91_24830 [Actinobacteria bacterium]|nr:hypothetical protein [Actinomycetota bacterium]